MKSGSVYKNLWSSKHVSRTSMVKKSIQNKYSFCREHCYCQTTSLLTLLLEEIIT